MISKILIASKNKNKVKEISEILFPFSYNLLSLSDFQNISVAPEHGKTFLENATQKAQFYFNLLKIPVIADDSGLVVPALNGAPGIHSARYAGEGAKDAEKTKKLLHEMINLSGDQRHAFFICNAVYYDGIRLLVAEGRVDGEIRLEPEGKNGFGFDPVFYYPHARLTFAQLGMKEKNKISHRALAIKDLHRKLQKEQ